MTTAQESKILTVLPLTPLQVGMYLQSSIAPTEQDPYLSHTLVTFGSAVDHSTVARSITAVLDRHPHLKAVLRQRKNGTLVWVVPRETTPEAVVLEGRMPGDEVDWDVVRADDRATGFDFLRRPLIRFAYTDRALLITYHHSLMDGWSEALFVRELLAACSAGGVSTAAEPAVPIQNFLGWLTAQDSARSRARWREYLGGFDLPTVVAPSTPVQDVQASPVRVDAPISAEVGERVVRCAQSAGVTVNVVVQLAWALVLSGLTSQKDVVFGMAASIRPYDLDGADSIIGLLLNTVPVRIAIDGSVSTTELLCRIQSAHYDLDEHRYLGLPDIIAETPHSTLFDTAVVYQNYPNAGPDAGSVEVFGAPMSFPLALIVGPDPALWAFLVYRPARVDAAVADGAATRFSALLDRLTLHPDMPVARVLASVAEEFGGIPEETPPTTFPSLERQLADSFDTWPDAIAIVSDSIQITYAELAGRVAALSGRLRTAGVGPESRVAVVLPRGVDMVAALLAILDVGAAVVPIDTRYPPDRITFLLEDSDPGAALVHGTTLALVESLAPSAVRIRVETVLPGNDRPFREAHRGSHSAYLIYTSGSTGTPKGVVGTRSALANRLTWATERWGAPRSRLAKSSLSFIDGTTELLTGLLAGQTVIVAGDDTFTDAYALARLTAQHGVQQITAVGSLAAAMSDVAPEDLVTVTQWIVSGEPLTADIVRSLRRANPTATLTNSYGSSEVAGDITTHDVPQLGNEISVGTAVPNTSVFVLDQFLVPVPSGTPGEVYVSGIQLARGYFVAPAATAGRFVPNPYGRAGDRLYRTGDRGRIQPDGALELLGRADRQVNIRGFRVELAEIEVTATRTGLVEAVAVVAAPDRTSHLRLIGFAVPTAGSLGDISADLDSSLRRSLPAHMVPTKWEILAALPLTPNGKLDRVALTARALSGTATVPSAPPQTDGERVVAALVSDITSVPVDTIGRHDDFFSLGGDSITAISFVHSASQKGLFFTTSDVFGLRTVAAIAGIARDRSRPVDAKHSVGLSDAERNELAELRIDANSVRIATPLQQGMVYQSVVAADDTDEIYIIATEFEISGQLDTHRLGAAVEALFERHPSLRSRFVTLRSGRTVAVRDEYRPIDIRREDVESFGSVRATALTHQDRATFDVERGPLVRVTVLDRSETQHRIVLTMHHVLVDGWSMSTVGTDLFRLYQHRDLDPPASFDAYLNWLSQRDADASTTAWRHALGPAPRPCLVSDADGRMSQVDAAEIDVTLTRERTARVTALAAEHGSTISEVIHAAWAVVLSVVTGQNDVVFGSTVSGRPADVERVGDMVGLFINTIPVRVDVKVDSTIAGLLDAVRDHAITVLDHHHVGLADIAKIAGTRTLFDTLVVFENFASADTSGIDSDDFQVRVGRFHTMTHYPVALTVFPGELLRLVVEYRPDLVDSDRADMMSSLLHTVLDSMALVDRTAGLQLLDPAAQHRILTEYAGTTAHYPGGTLVDVLHEQCARTPDAVAVTDRSTVLTFAQLRARSNRIARELIRLGVGSEDIVAVPATRSALTLATIVAIMKSGAAYLPVEPDAPADRTQRTIDSARPVALVTGPQDLNDNALLDGRVTLSGCVTLDSERLASSPDDDVDVTNSERRTALHPDHPVYLLYTSGTTGTPKGVVVPHRGLLNLYFSHRDRVHNPAVQRAGGRRLNVAHAWSLAFDASWQPQLWMFGGHAVHILDRSSILDPSGLTSELSRVSADFIELVPSLLSQVMKAGLTSEVSTLGVGGEAVPRELWNTIRDLESVVVHNFYGPTEATVDAVHVGSDESSSPVIGRPVTNLRAYVLDGLLRLVPPGIVGELYLGGPGVVRGYRDAPAQTSDRFVADPFSTCGSRLYRTGDLVSWTSDGLLEYTGRADHQVKIRGHRVELGDIEACVRSLDGVADARVVVGSSDQLSAHVIADSGCTLNIGSLRAAVAERLPSYMVPSRYSVLDAFPLLANGKFDAARLPDGDLPDRSRRQPQSEIERRLCSMMADVLHVPDIGTEDDFFDLGGDSIMSMELSSRLRAEGLAVSPRDVLTCRTVGALAVGLDHVGSASTIEALSPYGTVPPTPIVAWLSGLAGSIDQISQAVLLRVPSELTSELLLKLMGSLTRRHPILTAQFDGQSLTVTEPRATIPTSWLTVHDITTMPDAVVRETVRSSSRSAKLELDPASGRMMDVVWFRRDGEPGELLITVHHLVVDGVSWRVLLPDLASLWRDRDARRDRVVEASQRSFRNWAHAVHSHAMSDSILTELDRWAEIAAPGAALPMLRPMDPTTDVGSRVQNASFTLSSNETGVMLAAAASCGGTVEDLLFGTFTAALCRWVGAESESEFVIDMEGHGRNEVGGTGIDGLGVVGWLTDVHPVRIGVKADLHEEIVRGSTAAVHELVSRVQHSRSALPSNTADFGALRYVNPAGQRVLGALPTAAVQFNYLGRFDLGGTEMFGASRFRDSMDSGPGPDVPSTYAIIVDVHMDDSTPRGGGDAASTLTATLSWPDGVMSDVPRLAATWESALNAVGNPREAQ